LLRVWKEFLKMSTCGTTVSAVLIITGGRYGDKENGD
jgi:hypothetical protein